MTTDNVNLDTRPTAAPTGDDNPASAKTGRDTVDGPTGVTIDVE